MNVLFFKSYTKHVLQDLNLKSPYVSLLVSNLGNGYQSKCIFYNFNNRDFIFTHKINDFIELSKVFISDG